MKNGKWKGHDEGMITPTSSSIPDRSFGLAVRIVHLCRFLDRQPGTPRTLASQLLRAGTSIGANIEEGQAAQSKADFVAKYLIALKEARETLYWLRLIVETRLVQEPRIADVRRETSEIARMLGRAIVTARRRA